MKNFLSSNFTWSGHYCHISCPSPHTQTPVCAVSSLQDILWFYDLQHQTHSPWFKSSGTTAEEILNKPQLLKTFISVYLQTGIILQCSDIAPGEWRPRGWSFSHAESVCCLLFLPTVFWLEWRKFSWFPAAFQDFEMLFQFQLLNKKNKYRRKSDAEVGSKQTISRGCFGISDCDSPEDR